MKDKLSEKMMTGLVDLRSKACPYLTEDGSGDKKANGTKNYRKYKDLSLKTIKNVYKTTNLYKDNNKGLKEKCIMYLLNQLTRLY